MPTSSGTAWTLRGSYGLPSPHSGSQRLPALGLTVDSITLQSAQLRSAFWRALLVTPDQRQYSRRSPHQVHMPVDGMCLPVGLLIVDAPDVGVYRGFPALVGAVPGPVQAVGAEDRLSPAVEDQHAERGNIMRERMEQVVHPVPVRREGVRHEEAAPEEDGHLVGGLAAVGIGDLHGIRGGGFRKCLGEGTGGTAQGGIRLP